MAMIALPTPHLEKLTAALANRKLPPPDRPRLEHAVERYHTWIASMSAASARGPACVEPLVSLLSSYKLSVDLELIFDSDSDFLYRQKGQLKLDNSILEEFLPWLLSRGIPDMPPGYGLGPANCYAAIVFESSINEPRAGAGIQVRTKDQDFAVTRRLYLQASSSPDFSDATQLETFIAYVATEIKTNLDKTMFQEACATARDLRRAVPAARYFLMCEWLDMTPVSTAPTDIEEVLILRGKRLPSHVRSAFSSAATRRAGREQFREHLLSNPLRADIFARWLAHLARMFSAASPGEGDVLQQGYF